MKVMGVVGSGQMGSGIAQLGVMHGLDVWLVDTDPDALVRATKSISSSIQKFVSKGQLSQASSLCFVLVTFNCDEFYLMMFAKILRNSCFLGAYRCFD